MILIGDEIDPFDSATIRASMGSVFSLTFARTTPEHFGAWVAESGIQLIGTAPGASVSYKNHRFVRPTVLMIGSERQGMPSEMSNLCREVVSLPMVGQLDSLNVSVAAAIILYEILDQLHPLRPP